MNDDYYDRVIAAQVRNAQRWTLRLAWLGWAGAVAAAIALVLWASRAEAQVNFDCADLAMVIGGAADFRDAGADLDKTLAIARERAAPQGDAEQRVLEREIRRVWREQLPRRRAVALLYKRCRAQLGDMGRES